MKKFLYNLKWRILRPQAFAHYEFLKKNEFASPELLAQQGEAARRRIVTSAFKNTKFYRECYGAVGFELGDMEQDGWFEKLPILTKQHVRECFDELTNPNLISRRGVFTTGGSTGVPTRGGYDRAVPVETYSWRLQNWFGVNPWDDHAYVWRQTRQSWKSRFVNAAMWWPTRHLKLDANMNDEDIRLFLKKYNRLCPTLLQGYVGAVTQLARYVVEHKVEVWSPRLVWTTSAPISSVERGLIAAAFHAPICDQYGSCELGWMAQQCPVCKGLHVNVEHVHLEFVDEDNQPMPRGEVGRTLMTNLEDEVFPLIRYENGDSGSWQIEPCSCGRTLPCINAVKGRITEHFVLPSGRLVNEIFLTTIFDSDPDAVKAFKVIQHANLSITLEFVPASNDEAGIARVHRVANGLVRVVAGEVPVEFKPVEEIKHDRGKIRYVVREK